MKAIIIISAIVAGVIWGVVVDKVIENKGYSSNWFWWGFFFGIFALIVALTKPEAPKTKIISDTNDRSWECVVCGAKNSMYVGTCSCGNTREKNAHLKMEKIEQDNTSVTELNNLNKLKSYKDLLDQGVITQEEFDEKKKQLLK